MELHDRVPQKAPKILATAYVVPPNDWEPKKLPVGGQDHACIRGKKPRS